MIKIGLVNIDTSHPLEFSRYLNLTGRARYTAVYNDGFRTDCEVNSFMRQAGIGKRCDSIAQLAQCVDIGFIHSCNWDNHLEQTRYFIDAGKPVFIDKPVVGNIADCRELEQLADDGAVILGGSSVPYAEEITSFLALPESERGKILNIFGTSGVDSFNYAIHIVQAIQRIAQSDAVSVGFLGQHKINSQISESYSIKFENDVTAVYHSVTGLWQPFVIVIMTTTGTWHFQIDTTKIYGQLLDRICDFMETGDNQLVSVAQLAHTTKIMLAGRISRMYACGDMHLSDIPRSDPGFNGRDFEIEYAQRCR